MRALIAVTFASLLTLTASAFAAEAKVWVAPFEQSDKQPDWITRALQQSLTDELATLKTVDVQMSKEPTDATHIVKATVQRVDGEIRVTGRVEDKSGKNLSGFKATGSERDLFGIEDRLAQQIAKIVAPNEPLATTEPAKLQPIEAPFAPNVGGFEGSDLQRSMKDGVRRNNPPVVYSPPVYQQPMYPVTTGLNGNYYNNPYYNNGYGYGYGYGGYWGGGGTVVIINKGSHGGGGSFCPPNSGGGTFVPNNNGQAIRRAASWAGNAPSAMVNTSPGPQLVPGGASTGTGALPPAPHGR